MKFPKRLLCLMVGWLLLLILLPACQTSDSDSQPIETSVTEVTPLAPIGGNITIGSTVRDVLSDTTPAQRWLFTGEQGNTVIFELSRIDGNAVYLLQLLNAEGQILTSLDTQNGDFALAAPYILTRTGEYTLLVSRLAPATQGMYALTISDGIQPVAQAGTPTLAPSATATTIPASATPNMTVTATLRPTLILPTNTATLPVTVTVSPVTPTPTLVVTVNSSLSVPLPPGGRLEIGESRSGEITQPGEIHRFTFFGAAQEVVSIVMNLDPTSTGTLNPYLELQAPNGTIVAQNDSFLPNVLDALINQFELPATGVYTLYAKSRDNAGTGRYIIGLSNGLTLRDVERGEALQNLPNEQSLETYGQRDVWKIQLQQGDIVSVAVEVIDRASDFNVMAELVSPEGEAWFDDNSGADNDAYLDKIQAPVAGDYLIHIAANNNATIGAYRLWWQIIQDPPTPVPVIPTTPPTAAPTATPLSAEIIGTVGENRTSTYTVQINAGQSLSVEVVGVEGFDSVLRVFDPLGNILVEVDDVGASVDPSAFLVVETSGLYTLEMSGFEGASGSFTLKYDIQ